jgi:hypothetical protein
MIAVLSPHYQTIAPRLRHSLSRPGPDGAEAWSTTVADERWGTITITGRLDARPGARDAFVIVHGLGGCAESHYMRPAARAATEVGAACLRLEMRGSNGAGEDLYHAALVQDLVAAIASPELAPYGRIFLVGFSLGGHLALRYAVEEPDSRLCGVAAVCSPLDLAASQVAFDRPSRWLYRQYVLGRLKQLYRPIAARRELATPLEEVLRVATIREWDRLTVVPRFGFRDVDHYYAEESVGPRLGRLAVPGLLVAALDDPMVPREAIEPALETVGELLDVRWVDGAGHVGFPRDLDLGFAATPGLEHQVVAWLRARQ